MDKSKIRSQINNFCKKSLIDGRLIGAKPAILPIFLGKETEQTVNASLKDAFAGIFQTELDTFDIGISDAEVDAEQLFQQVVAQLRRAQNAGAGTDNFKVPIIALMDETFFQEESLPLTETIRTVFQRLENNRLAGKVAFYGVFRQSEKEGTNYQNAFAFVNAGKDIWRNIYHIEVSLLDSDIQMYAQLIAVHLISNEDEMEQPEGEHYSWKSVYAHCLRMPELQVTRNLNAIYKQQIQEQQTWSEENKRQWVLQFKDQLQKELTCLYDRQEYDAGYEQYLPISLKCERTAAGLERRPRFKLSNFLRSQGMGEQHSIHVNVIEETISYKQLLEEISKSIRVHRTDCKELLKSIITSYESVNMKRDIMEQCIGKALEDMEGAYKKQLASQKNQNLEIKNETDLEKYLKREYQDKKEKFLVQEKIRLLREIKKLLKEQGLNSILESIRKENDDYQNVLRELSGEYGGTPEQQTVPNVSEQITVNEPVEFVLRKLQMDLNILDAEMLRQFLNRVTEIMPHKHLLGRINDQYRDLEEITVKLLLQPEMIGNPTIVGIINNWPVSTNALYRNNTFYVISSRRYTSELAINDYSRG